ncbi:hypothetical protein [Halovivax cerinus]|uniref:Uncharacterized protein n=1 Tax=Halovivax cerinus TaxID=1487865 RepID=A0ABD5NSW1_9EURY|nr:hypothetical protein [Halovivax cerinus]
MESRYHCPSQKNECRFARSAVIRLAIQETVDALEVMDALTSESGLTGSDVQEIADKINESGRKRDEEESV